MSILNRIGLASVFACVLAASFAPASASNVNPPPSDPVTNGITDLKDGVSGLVFEGDLTPAQGTLLLRLLDSAQLRHNQGKDAAAGQLILSFESYLNKFLDEEITGELLFEADVIYFLLTGKGGGGGGNN